MKKTLIVLSYSWLLYNHKDFTDEELDTAIFGQGRMSLDEIDPDMPRAAIAAEDAKFCQHHGFDAEAIEKAYLHNERGGRIRGGSTWASPRPPHRPPRSTPPRNPGPDCRTRPGWPRSRPGSPPG